MTPSGIESVTFRFVAQRLNHCATAVLRSCLLRDCKEICPVIIRPLDARWLPVRRIPANNFCHSASFGVVDNNTKCLLLQMCTLFVKQQGCSGKISLDTGVQRASKECSFLLLLPHVSHFRHTCPTIREFLLCLALINATPLEMESVYKPLKNVRIMQQTPFSTVIF